jgi:hypothetical protein
MTVSRPPATVTRAEVEALRVTLLQITAALNDDRAMRTETHAMVTGLHHALIDPEPGHDHGLLHRMAAVTIAAETGRAAGEWIIWGAKVAAAASIILGALWAVIRFGHDPRPPRP